MSRPKSAPIHLTGNDISSGPVVLDTGHNATLSTLFNSINSAIHGSGGDNVAKLWSRMNDRLGTEEGRPDLLGDSVPEAEVELYCEFGLRDVGKGKVCFGKPDIFESEYEDSVDTHKQCFVYISLIVKPEGWKIPVFGNYGSRAERLSKRTGEHLKNVLDMPLDVARGKMPWVWSDYDCSYSVEKLYGDRMMVAILSNYTAGGYWDLFRGA